jgi:hypothetical protein
MIGILYMWSEAQDIFYRAQLLETFLYYQAKIESYMASKKRIKAKAKNQPTAMFEIIVILAIVVIVAVTGQVLIYYGNAPITASDSEGNMLSGFAVAEDTPALASQFLDVGVTKIEVAPESPLIGEPFEVKVTISNQGQAETNVPFYVGLDFVPQNTELGNLKPITLSAIMTKLLKPGESGEVSVYVTTIMPEGPLRIIATADSTAKLPDANPSNNKMSKTIILTNS